jgi:aspartate racemase
MLGLVMPGVDAIKAGDMGRGRALLHDAARALQSRGAVVVLLGCTEIPLVFDAGSTEVPTIDATAALARRAVAWSLSRREAATV